MMDYGAGIFPNQIRLDFLDGGLARKGAAFDDGFTKSRDPGIGVNL